MCHTCRSSKLATFILGGLSDSDPHAEEHVSAERLVRRMVHAGAVDDAGGLKDAEIPFRSGAHARCTLHGRR